MKTIEFNRASAEDQRLADLVEEIMARVQLGETCDVDQYVVQYPEYADRLRGWIGTMTAMADLGHSLSVGAASRAAPDAEEGPPRLGEPTAGILGDFRILRELGRGGMGVVYEAEQISLGRHVALKVLPFAAMLDKQQLARFKNEARAAATLDHPNIVSIHSVGSERGVHYYAMQLIEGRSLAEIIAELKPGRPPSHDETAQAAALINHATAADTVKAALPTVRATGGAAFSTIPPFESREYYRTVARLGIQAAEALDHAHQNGILHRDIKPANLLLDDDGKLWITDFGLARIEQDAGMTMTGDLLGTLRYMSPEQALAKRVVVDHRSDIYSLGVTLYELLTLKPAFPGEDRQELLRQIAFDEPKPPRQVNARIPQDIQTIISKAFEKNPADRYPTAKEFGDDLRRFLDHQPIKAKPANYLQQLMKWSRRHVAVVWSALAASLLAVVLLGVSTMLVSESRNDADFQRAIATHEKDKAVDQRNLAVEERNNARLNQYYAEIVSGQSDLEQGNITRLHQKLIRQLPHEGDPDYRDWEWYYLFSLCHQEQSALYLRTFKLLASWSPDGQYIGAGSAIWKAQSGECIRLFATPDAYACAWSPDSGKFAWGTLSDDSAIYIWDRHTDAVQEFRGHDGSVWCVAFSPNGSRFASGSIDGTVKLWDVATRKVLKTFRAGHNVDSVAWSADGELVAAGARNVYVWSVATGESVMARNESMGSRITVSWHPDGKRLAVNTPSHWYILNRSDWTVALEHKHPLGRISNTSGAAIKWNAAGTQLAYSIGSAAAIWDPLADKPLVQLVGHVEPITSIAWNPDGHQLMTTDRHKEIRIWAVDPLLRRAAIETGATLRSLSWEPDSDALVTVAASDLSSSFWNCSNGTCIKQEKIVVPSDNEVRVLSPNRRYIARSTKSDNTWTISIQDGKTGVVRSIYHYEAPFQPLIRSDGRTVAYAWSPDGSQLAVPIASDTCFGFEVWDVSREQRIARWTRRKLRSPLSHHDSVRILTWSPDGARIAAVGLGDAGDGDLEWASHVHVIDAASGKRIFKYAFGESITTLTWNANSRFLAMAGTDGLIKIADVEAGVTVMNCQAHDVPIHSLSWSPDGKRLASGAADGIVKILEPCDGSELLSLRTKDHPAVLLSWSPDGRRLAGATDEGTVQVWDATRGYAFGDGGSRNAELAWIYYDLARGNFAQSATRALKKSVELAPKKLDYRMLRGDALAKLGQYDEAAREFAAATPAQIPLGFEMADRQMYALLGARDLDAYRQLRGKLLDVDRATNIPSHHNEIAWFGTLIPNTTDGFEDCMKSLKKKMATRQTGDSEADNGQFDSDSFDAVALGAMLYRLGRYSESAETLGSLSAKSASATAPAEKYNLALGDYFLAMSRQQLGHDPQAERCFHEANALQEKLQNDPSTTWISLVELNTLRREAKGLIEP